MRKFIREFKDFIAKGSVIDMAVAVVIGGAFSKIVSSLVNDIIMPLIGLVVGGTNISELKWVFTEQVLDDAGKEIIPEAALTYGVFIQAVIDFFLIALCIFIFLKIILAVKSKVAKPKEEEAAAPEEPKETADDILAEIRDILKEQKTGGK